MNALWGGFKQLKRHPSALAGVTIITALVCLSIYAITAIPYSEAIRLWRGGEGIWDESPRNAVPRWVNLFTGKKLPETIILDTGSDASKSVEAVSEDIRTVKLSMPFDYPYDDFPSELTLFLAATFDQQRPKVSMFWLTPDGRQLPLGERSISATERYSISLDQRLREKLGGQTPEV